ncbi:tetratricopeptide repeat protein [Nocardia abscessus]|uniref:tetratricopeptide repeat protein n=1 Tax=Nocardia abscessus TaxID=120957 RepID=UPI002456620E|nr:tetratricopeptide repeat protein [Nocardia abscessus]
MRYTAHVTGRDGRWWAVWIPALGEDARTQARRLADVENEARDYISVTLDVPPSEVDVEVYVDDIEKARDIQQRSSWILAARKQIELLETEVQKATKSLVGDLSNVNVPIRDIATLVGTTFQRVGQLVSDRGEEAKTSEISEFFAISPVEVSTSRTSSLNAWNFIDVAFPARYMKITLRDREKTSIFAERLVEYLISSYGSFRSATFLGAMLDKFSVLATSELGQIVPSFRGNVKSSDRSNLYVEPRLSHQGWGFLMDGMGPIAGSRSIIAHRAIDESSPWVTWWHASEERTPSALETGSNLTEGRKRTSTALALGLARALQDRAELLAGLDRRVEALDSLDEAVSLYRNLAAESPGDSKLHLAQSLQDRAELLAGLDRRVEALDSLDEAVSLYRNLAAESPGDSKLHLAPILQAQAELLSQLDRNDHTVEFTRQAVRTFWRVADSAGSDTPSGTSSVVRNLTIAVKRHVSALEGASAVHDLQVLRRKIEQSTRREPDMNAVKENEIDSSDSMEPSASVPVRNDCEKIRDFG